jgi:Protein of unknown function (DUF1344)
MSNAGEFCFRTICGKVFDTFIVLKGDKKMRFIKEAAKLARSGRSRGSNMLKNFLFLIAAMMFALPDVALADEIEGKIEAIDETAQTLKLDDGSVYKLPGEFDYSVIEKNMKVTIVFDVSGEDKMVTDIELAE